MEPINVVSTFNGMGCIWYALDDAGIPVNKRYSSEIDKYAIEANQAAYSDTIQVGDVTKWREWNIDWSTIDLFVGGSPCQGFSFAGKQLNFDDERSKLFFVFVEIWNHIKKHNTDAKFLLENVNMKKEYLRVISEYMGVFPVRINSNLVSAQNRDRWYWTNIRTKETGLFRELWTDIPQPEDKGILLKDILQDESEVDEKYYLSNKAVKRLMSYNNFDRMIDITGKGMCLTAGYDKIGRDNQYVCITNIGRRLDKNGVRKDNDKSIPYTREWRANLNGKSNCLTTVDKDNLLTNGIRIRRLTPREKGRLQTFTDKQLDVLLNTGISDTQLGRMFGNGWTNKVISHILSFYAKEKGTNN